MSGIIVTTPPGVAGPADVVVTNPDGQSAVFTGGFTYIAPAPSIASVSPGSGPVAGGTQIVVSGADLEPGAIVTVGGVVAPVSATPTAKTDPGPNLPPGLTEVFAFDVTRTDQSAVNLHVDQQIPTALWDAPETGRGLFLNQVDGADLFARFMWAMGDKERIAGNSIRLDTYWTKFYIRVTWRMNANWQWSGGGGKHFYFQNSPWVPSQNTAIGMLKNGHVSIAAMDNVWGPTAPDMGNWIDDEWYLSAVPGPSDVKGWRNNILEFEGTGFDTHDAPANVLRLGPFHGGQDVKSQDGDFWDIKRLVVWAA